MNETKNEVTTEWDSSKATLYRIDELLKECKRCAINKDFQRWFLHLTVLKREAVVKMNPEQKKGCNALMDSVENKIIHLDKARLSLSGYISVQKLLSEAEEYIREVMDSKGMLMKNARTGMDRFVRG